MALSICGKRIDDPTSPYIIAEASGNHAGSMDIAQTLVRVAAEAGADAIKFQTFTAESICADVPILFGHDKAHDAWCERLGVTRMRELFAKGGLPRAWHKQLSHLADCCGIIFISTPFSVDDARFLVEEVGVPAIKIASGDLTFTPLHEYAVSTGLPIILSTGGAYLSEIITAIDAGPLLDAKLGRRLVVLHCVSSYPASLGSANLRCIPTMQQTLHVPIGFSDHTLSIDLVPQTAVALGATVLEKHIRLDGIDTTVDADHSLPPGMFRQYVHKVRGVELILGSDVKSPVLAELHDRLWARRSPGDWLRPTQLAREGNWQ